MGHLVPDGVKQEGSGRRKDGRTGGSPRVHCCLGEKTVTDKLNSFVIDIVVGRFSQFGQHVYDEQLNLVRLKKGKKDWTNKGDHESAGVGVLPSASHSRYS